MKQSEWDGLRVRMGGNEGTAQRWVYWLGRQLLQDYTNVGAEPVPGDLVMEISHLCAGAKKQIGLEESIGILKRIETDEQQNKTYVLELADKTEQRWSNAYVKKIKL